MSLFLKTVYVWNAANTQCEHANVKPFKLLEICVANKWVSVRVCDIEN